MRGRSSAGSVLVLVAGLAAAGCGSAVVSAQHTASPATALSPSVSAAPSAPAATSPPPGTVSPSAPTSPPTTAPPAAAAPAVLTSGMSGPAVLQLQQRLAALKYYPGPEDGQFGTDTLEAVWAFQETQGLPATGTVGAATQAALANPGNPAVLVPDGGATRVEVNLSDEVLVLYQAGQVALVSHVSSGGGYYFCTTGGCGYAVTPTGDFHTISFMPGWITVPLGEMYNPVFFIGSAFAIHGDTYVPLQPVSHGCVRIPMDVAAFFHTLVPTPGTPVYIRS
jgi:Putative peptidoglycan binding domain/L,D-transpeptidase catalytic domain